METSMLIPFLIMVAAFTLIFYWLLLRRLQGEIVDREQGTRWLREFAGVRA
jgi:preprotein translocase subunit YajC